MTKQRFILLKKGFFCILLHRRYTYSINFNTDSRTLLQGIRLTATELKETYGLGSENRPRSGHEPREEYCWSPWWGLAQPPAPHLWRESSRSASGPGGQRRPVCPPRSHSHHRQAGWNLNAFPNFEHYHDLPKGMVNRKNIQGVWNGWHHDPGK